MIIACNACESKSRLNPKSELNIYVDATITLRCLDLKKGKFFYPWSNHIHTQDTNVSCSICGTDYNESGSVINNSSTLSYFSTMNSPFKDFIDKNSILVKKTLPPVLTDFLINDMFFYSCNDIMRDIIHSLDLDIFPIVDCESYSYCTSISNLDSRDYSKFSYYMIGKKGSNDRFWFFEKEGCNE